MSNGTMLQELVIGPLVFSLGVFWLTIVSCYTFPPVGRFANRVANWLPGGRK